MKRKRLLSLLVLLMAAVTGAWAKTYTVTFGGFGNNAMNRSVTYPSMPQEITNIGGIEFIWMKCLEVIWGDLKTYLSPAAATGRLAPSATGPMIMIIMFYTATSPSPVQHPLPPHTP